MEDDKDARIPQDAAEKPSLDRPRETREQLALEVVGLARDQIVAEHHFLAQAAVALRPICARVGAPLATDGRTLWVDPDIVLYDFRRTKEPPVHDLVHVLMHCLLLHPFVNGEQQDDPASWSLATDVVAEKLTAQVAGPREGARGEATAAILSTLRSDMGEPVSAERTFRRLHAGEYADLRGKWAKIVRVDNPMAWYQGEAEVSQEQGTGSRGVGADKDQDSKGSGGRPRTMPLSDEEKDALRKKWAHISKSTRVDLQTLSRSRGEGLGDLTRELEEVNRERTSYSEFLRRFASMQEALRVSPDEFDYVLYSYGLQLYGNLPLIENLEYREQRLIRDFVIVIDTSGSVDGEAVREFVGVTFDLLTSGGVFCDRVNVHVLQVDAAVQSDTKLASVKDLQKWQGTFKLKGFGGTDFRPAFAYVEKLRARGELREIGGLIYFTDGWGIYPERMPRYKVAFVFYDEDYRPEIVPPWVIKMVLSPGELDHERHLREVREQAREDRAEDDMEIGGQNGAGDG